MNSNQFIENIQAKFYIILYLLQTKYFNVINILYTTIEIQLLKIRI